MARPLRQTPGGLVYHVLNRANARATIFHHAADYAAFETALGEALGRHPLELFAYCLMPNHFHLVVRPREDGQLSEFMRWLTVTHTRRHHLRHHTWGTGHLFQGRFKSFVVESDGHFLVLCRYVERNALRANLVRRDEDWRWGSLWRRSSEQEAGWLSRWPVEEPVAWSALVNRPQSAAEEAALRRCVNKGSPFGGAGFVQWTTELLGLVSPQRGSGRPAMAKEVK